MTPAPEGFADAYERMGWEARDALGMDTPRFLRLIAQAGGDDLKRRRRNYVLGNRFGRVSSLKLA